MARFQKTRIHAASAVLCLLGLYALAGLVYAAWVHSDESVGIWAGIAVAAFVAAFAIQRYITARQSRREIDGGA
jgi:hypothetical protein